MSNLKILPDYFSEQAINTIKCWSVKLPFYVYRIGKYGDKKTAFYNYYDEVIHGLKVVRKKESNLKRYQKDIDALSVSCYYDKKDIIYYYSVTLKESYPNKILLYGYTCSNYGLSSLTKWRKQNKRDSHIDWWLYYNVTPCDVFKEVKLNE